MIAPLLLSVLASPSPAPVAPAVPAAAHAPFREESSEKTYEERFAEAGDDTAALWELHKWCKEQGKIIQARECLKRIVELAPDHEEARSALGHHRYDGKWFKSYYELTEYKRAEEERMLEEHGLVRFEDEWVPVEDRPYLRMGMVKDEETGGWITKRELAEREQAEEYREKGWEQQADLVWVPPDEQSNWEKGLVKCGDEWMTAEEANEYHSVLGRWWTLPSERRLFEIWSTCPWSVTYRAGQIADSTYPDLKRAYGISPSEPPVVVVLNSPSQYNLFAAGDREAGLPSTEEQGFSSIHYAYFAESWFLPYETPEYAGTGVCLWNMSSEQRDAVGHPDPYGRHAVRHAAALAYAEAIDPSLETVSQATASPGQQRFPFQAFWKEKTIPLWFRIGVATYCERYFRDPSADVSEGYSPWWAREWSLENIRKKGGPLPFEEIFAMTLDANDVEGSSTLINQAGMVVSFVLDGDCKPVVDAHRALKQAIAAGGDTSAADRALREAIVENEEAFHLHVKM